jgi:hypothetical protein
MTFAVLPCAVSIDRSDGDSGAVRIDILEELRLNTKDLREQSRQAIERAKTRTASARSTVELARAERNERRANKNR